MRNKFKIILLLLFLLPCTEVMPNPIKINFFSELMFDSTGWTLELNRAAFEYDFLKKVNGWYLESRSGRAYFKDDLNLDSLNYVIKSGQLSSYLSINRFGDKLTLYDSSGYMEDQIIFGDLSGSAIAAPPLGWSICVTYGWAGSQVFYFDKSPTIGAVNDTSGTVGYIEGFVKDSTGIPVDSARVVYDNEGLVVNPTYIYALTDSTGFYRIEYLARRVYLFALKTGFVTSSDTVQIWPDSVVSTNFELNPNISHVSQDPAAPTVFSLSQNYPNPFNPETIIGYSIGSGTQRVELKVYDVMGRIVTTLVNGYKSAGKYTVKFNGSDGGGSLASGIYFYILSAGDYLLVKKMILLK